MKAQASFDFLFALLLLSIVIAALLPSISSSLSNQLSASHSNSQREFLMRSSIILQSCAFLPEHSQIPSPPLNSQSGSNCISDSSGSGCIHMPLSIESRWGVIQYGGIHGKTPV